MANEKFKDKIVKVFGMEAEDDGYDDEIYDDDEMINEPETDAQATGSSSKKKTVSRHDMAGLAGGTEVLVLDPEFFDDAPGIVNKIKENKTVVVNLKNTEYEDGRKIFDFLNGAVFALEGSINKIAENVFILAPKQVSVSTEMDSNEDSDYITPPILDFDSEE
ncbi:MAG: cell division protein SepF [Eubacteriaceae bacterium]|jgi:cell division inhibitor SepF|nr:cell division protein SepF [Eubacteriaceae bacterium]MDD4507623.1 cell division protein SepF [Eubacteriaceae bacterium]